MKNLEKITKLYHTLQELDKEIIKVGELANQLLFDKTEVEFTLQLKNKSKPVKANIFDEDGSLQITAEHRPTGFHQILGGYDSIINIGHRDDEEKKNPNKIKGALSTKMSILFIDILLKEMDEKRNVIEKKIKKLINYEQG